MATNSIDEKQFQEMIEAGKTFLVDYWAPWCGYCRRIAPAYDQIAQQYQNVLTAVKVNIDEEASLADMERIEVIPTLILYQDGKPIASIVAPDSKAKIDAFLRDALAI